VFVAVGINALLILFVGFYVHRIALHLQEKDEATGRLMQILFEKLDALPDFSELALSDEPPNPLHAIFAQFLNSKMEATTIGRSDVGQFTRAEIIPPD